MKRRSLPHLFRSLLLCLALFGLCYAGFPAFARVIAAMHPTVPPGSVPLVSVGPGPRGKVSPIKTPLPTRRTHSSRDAYADKVYVATDALGYNVFLSAADSTELFNLGREDFVALEMSYVKVDSVEVQDTDNLVFIKNRRTVTFCWALRKGAPYTVETVGNNTKRIRSDDGAIVIQTKLHIYMFNPHGSLPTCP